MNLNIYIYKNKYKYIYINVYYEYFTKWICNIKKYRTI